MLTDLPQGGAVLIKKKYFQLVVQDSNLRTRWVIDVFS